MEPEIVGYRFDRIVLDLRNRQLWREKQNIPLNAKYFDVLVFLISRYQKLVTRDMLFDQIWSGMIVTDWALSQCIKDIRKVLGDNAKNPRYIKTFPKHGFMFIQQPIPLLEDQAQPYFLETHIRRPFKFLDYFTESDADLFFGRENDIKNICSKIIAHRSVVLYGKSGAGKSSLAHAGILPALDRLGHRVVILRGYPDPVPAMSALLDTGNREISEKKKAGDVPALNGASPVLQIFILDQFEEYFTLGSAGFRKKFLENIERWLRDPVLALHLIFIVREDYLGQMSQLKTVLPEIFYHEHHLEYLDLKSAESAIVEPLKRMGYSCDPDLIRRIVLDLAVDDRVDPSQLQIVADTLFDQVEQFSGLTLENYHEQGGAVDILKKYLEQVLRRFNADDREIARVLLSALIGDENQRQVVTVSRIYQMIDREIFDQKQAGAVIGELVTSRIVRYFQRDGEPCLELMHDILVPEISRWQTEEDKEKNRARALLQRMMENYRVHGILPELDAIQVILSCRQCGLPDPAEAEMLAKSLIKNGILLPQKLLESVPAVDRILTEGSKDSDPAVRNACIQSIAGLAGDTGEEILRERALWDEDLGVRKSASITLLQKKDRQAIDRVLDGQLQPLPGKIRQAISLSFMRDHDRKKVPLRRAPLLIGAMVLLALLWVRLRRDRERIWRKATGGTLGAGLSGFLVGMLLGLALVYLRQAPLYESMTLVLVLSSLGTLTGSVAGFGISLGTSAMQAVSYRHHPYWAVAGAVLGGALIGGLMHLIGVDTFLALFGQQINGIAGAYEGALMGLGISLGYISGGDGRLRPVLQAALGAMLASVLLTLIQGNLFSASIEAIARSFSNSYLKLDHLARFLGEAHFGDISRLVLGALEGFLFGGLLALGMDRFKPGVKNR